MICSSALSAGAVHQATLHTATELTFWSPFTRHGLRQRKNFKYSSCIISQNPDLYKQNAYLIIFVSEYLTNITIDHFSHRNIQNLQISLELLYGFQLMK